MVSWNEFVKVFRKFLFPYSARGYHNLVEADYTKYFNLVNDGGLDSLGVANLGLDLEVHYDVDLGWEKTDFPTNLGDLFDLTNNRLQTA